ncbi:MAG: hypothetical protein JXR79_07865 [Nitrospirae bacterium]|nr:hypothetical protein [Nitrospirota bacterium]
MKNMTIKSIFAALVLIIALATSADAKWWIFGQSNDEVSASYIYLNKTNYEESGSKVTLYKDALQDGMILVNGKASVRKGKVGSIRITTNNKETWQDAKLSENGAFEFRFRPESGKTYVMFIEIMDTSGKTNDIEATRKEVTISDQNIAALVRDVLDKMVAAYSSEDAGRFMSFVSEDFAGDSGSLDRAIRRDFSAFDNIMLRYTINNVSSGANGMVYVSINYNRSVTSSKDARVYTDRGMTELVFKLGSNQIFSMKSPLIFGLSDAANIATGSVVALANENVLKVDNNLNVSLVPLNEALEEDSASATVESSSNILLSTTGHPPAGFVFVDGEAISGPGDISITGYNATPPQAGYGFLGAGVTISNLGTVGINNVTEAPSSGYSAETNPPGGGAIYLGEGNTYAFKLADGKYGLLEVISAVPNGVGVTMRINYKYQTNGTRRFR